MRIHRRKDRLGQPVTLQQVAEVEDCCLVRNTIIAQLDPGKAAHRLTVIERLLGHQIAQGIPILKKVDAQHRLQQYRWTSALRSDFRIMRRDQSQQTAPRHHSVHLRQEHLATRLLFLHRITQAGKCRLLWHQRGSLQGCRSLPDQAKFKSFFRRSQKINFCLIQGYGRVLS
jgi:hypothetical protein